MLTIAALTGLLAAPALGADWSLSASITERGEYNDNRSLLDPSPGSVYGLLSQFSSELVRKTPTLQTSFTADLDLNRFAGRGKQRGFDTFNQNYGISNDYKTKTASYGLPGSYSIQDTSSSQLLDTGITNVDAQSITSTVTGTTQISVNRKNKVDLSVSAQNKDFTGNAASFTPSSNYDASTGWIYSITALTAADLDIGWSLFDADNTAKTLSQTYRTSAGISSMLWDGFVVSVGAGFALTQTRERTAGPGRKTRTADGILFDFGIDYTFKTTTISLAAEQGVEPSSAGEVQDKSTADLTITHQINRNSSDALADSFQRQKSQSGGQGTKRDLATVSPTYSIKLARNWLATIGYQFTCQDNSITKVTSNLVFVSLKHDLQLLP